MFRVVFLVLCLLMGCSERKGGTTIDKREDMPDQESWNVTITLSEQGKVRSVVHSGHLVKYDERKFVHLDQNVDADFFDAMENHTSNLKAVAAEVEENNDFMRAMDNVVVVSDSGVTLYTDTLIWDSKEEVIYTDDQVMLTTEKGDTLYGLGFESDVALENWRILKPSGVTNLKSSDE